MNIEDVIIQIRKYIVIHYKMLMNMGLRSYSQTRDKNTL